MRTPSTASDLRVPSRGAYHESTHLFVVMNCAVPLELPSRHGLEEVDEVRIGRGPKRSAVRCVEDGHRRLVLDLKDTYVSTAHALLLRRDGNWHIGDLGSKNGTFVNGRRASASPLADGDCLQVGQTLLLLRTALPTPARCATDLEAAGQFPAFATLLPFLAYQLDVLARVATSPIPVLLISETGTGKELLARAVHDLSRRTGRFVPVNCGGIPQTLMESVLFGHKRGAFSGALADHPGLFQAASGGTLFLDEVGDMAAAIQSALLRALQDGEVLPVGETRAKHIDVRFVAATHRNLEALVSERTFREDLLARLSGFTFRSPPLRERREDIGLLVGALLRRSARDGAPAFSLSSEAGRLLLQHSWPQNVRELERSLLRATAVAIDGRIEEEHLSDNVRGNTRVRQLPSSEHEVRTKLVKLLEESHGNVSTVAETMRTSRSQVHRWMKRFEIRVSMFR